MRYNILDLVVVHVEEDSISHYFVCKKKKNGKYQEILTDKIINVKEEKVNVSPLAYYFNEKELGSWDRKLSKKEILDKYVVINEYYRINYGNRRSSSNQFGDKNYTMKKSYQADELVVAELKRISNDFDFEELSVAVITTEQKYLFEIVWEDAKMKYREVFTGFIANDKSEYINLPYVGNPKPLVEVLPELEHRDLSKLNLILVSNNINDITEDKKKYKVKRRI